MFFAELVNSIRVFLFLFDLNKFKTLPVSSLLNRIMNIDYDTDIIWSVNALIPINLQEEISSWQTLEAKSLITQRIKLN